MPNGIEAPKVVLARQAEVPKVALGGTPLAALGLGVTGVLNSIASLVPDIPVLPLMAGGLPAFPTSTAIPKIPVVTEFIKSIETGLPTGLPKLTGQGTTGAKEEVAPAPKKAPALVFE